MRISRVRFSLQRLMVVVAAVGDNFGVLPWPACAVVGAAMTLPMFLSSTTSIEWVVIYSIAGVPAGLSLPAVVPDFRRGRGRIAGGRLLSGPASPSPHALAKLRSIRKHPSHS
jgi:hypothetical protein